MAKKRDRISAGLSIKDILNIPMKKFEQYTPTQQRELVSRLASAANKRYKTFEKKGIVNPAVLAMKMEGGKISVRNKSVVQIYEEYFRAKKFLKSEFSTQKGYKEYMSKLQSSIEKNGGKGIKKGMKATELYSTAFAYYDILQDLDPKISNIKDKYKIANKIAEYIEEGKDEKEVFEDINKYLANEYEREQENYNSMVTSFGDRIEDDTPSRYKRKGL